MKQDNTCCYREKYMLKIKSSLQEILCKLDIFTILSIYCQKELPRGVL